MENSDFEIFFKPLNAYVLFFISQESINLLFFCSLYLRKRKTSNISKLLIPLKFEPIVDIDDSV